MSFEFDGLRRLGSRISITLKRDENGYLGRECPAPDCEGYFLVKPGTGLTGDDLPCHCPYCGHTAGSDHFYTPEQIAYAQSVALGAVTKALRDDLKKLEFDLPAKGTFGIGISMKLKPGAPVPIRHYREKALETFVTCASCTLEYGVYGVFGYCPDCAEHNSVQILERNLDLTRRQVALAEQLDDPALLRHLLQDALGNCVAALDGFGREAIRVRAGQSTDPAKCGGVSFQNLGRAADRIAKLFGVDLRQAVSRPTWETAHRGFMKRHVVAHRAGVVDQQYLDETGEAAAVVGRRVPLDSAEVTAVADAVLEIGRTVVRVLPPPDRTPVPAR
jgi:hypothetical protein